MPNYVISAANGNFLDAATWGKADQTSLNLSEISTTAMTSSYVASSTWSYASSPPTVDGVAIQFSAAGTGGTLDVQLWDGSAQVALVTVNVTDLPNPGWAFFKFGSPVALNTGINYSLRLRVNSGSGTTSVYVSSPGSGNWSKLMRTTTTGAPIAGDMMWCLGDLTGAGTGNNITVTGNETAATIYGGGSPTSASLVVGKRGILTWATTASTAYQLKISGLISVEGGGVMNIGSTAARTSTSPTYKIILNSANPVDFGIRTLGNGQINIQGASMTSWTKLTANAAAGQAILHVASTSGWLPGDNLIIESSDKTTTHYDSAATILTVDSGTQVTLAANLTYAHYGTGNLASAVINLTRNIQIYGASATNTGYVTSAGAGVIDADYAEFLWLGSNTTGKRGVNADSTTGSCSFDHCSTHDCTPTGACAFFTTAPSTTGNNVTVNDCVMFNCTNGILLNGQPTGSNGNFTFSNNVCIAAQCSIFVVGTIDNNYVSSSGTALVLQSTASTTPILSVSGNVVHSCSTAGVEFRCAGNPFVFANFQAHFNATAIFFNQAERNIVFDTGDVFGNTTALQINNAGGIFWCDWNNVNFMGFNDGTNNFAQTTGFSSAGAQMIGVLRNCTFSKVVGSYTAHTQDLAVLTGVNAFTQLAMFNCLLGASTEVVTTGGFNNASPNSFILSVRHDQTDGAAKAWSPYGILQLDTTAGMYVVSPSLRLTPNNATNRLKSFVGGLGQYSFGKFRVAVKSGDTCTVTVKVRESVAGDGTDYNGQRVRLIVEANAIAGITSDTVLATATVNSEGAFELLSGMTIAVAANCVLSFYVDCGGSGYSGGWVNVDEWTANRTEDTKGGKYWPMLVGDNNAANTEHSYAFIG